MRVVEAWNETRGDDTFLVAIVEDAQGIVAGQSFMEYRDQKWAVLERLDLDDGPRSKLVMVPAQQERGDGGTPAASVDARLVAALEDAVPARVAGEAHILTKVVCAMEFADSKGDRYVVMYNTTAGGGHVPSWDQMGLMQFALDQTRQDAR